MPTILVVDDAPDILRITRDYLEHAGFSVLTAGDARGALQLLGTRHPDLVVLELGADDYITKPFSPKELVARVRAVLRRAEAARAPSNVLRVRDLELDVGRMRVSVAGRQVELTATEFQLLAAMARQPSLSSFRAARCSGARIGDLSFSMTSVGISATGSMNAVSGTGIRSMSDS